MKMLKNLFQSCKLVLSSNPIFLFFFIVQTLTGAVSVYIPVLVTKLIVNGFYEELSFLMILKQVIPYFLALFALRCIDQGINLLKSHKQRLFLVKTSVLFFNKITELDYAFYDNPEFLNDYTRALEESNENIFISFNELLNFIKICVMSLSLFSLFFQLEKVTLVFIIIISIIYMGMRYIASKLEYKMRTIARPHRRFVFYSNRIFTLKDSMQELKTTKIADVLLEKLEDAHDHIIQSIHHFGLPKAIFYFISSSLMMLLYPAIIAVVLFKSNGNLTSTDIAVFSSLTVAATSISSLIKELTSSIANLQGALLETQIPFDLLAMKGNIEVAKGLQAEHFKSLELKKVSFGYDQGKNTLDEISLKINKGNRIAIVGANGAGKTTLVKLLLRLYDVTEGSVLYNGIDFKEYSTASLRNKIGAVFQNVETYAVSVAENILLRTPTTIEDFKILNEAIAFAGLEDFIAGLSEGVNTLVTKEFNKNGVIFSGGLNQRLAIARGFAAGYELFILDEPSSALDPIAESKLYENMYQLGRDKTLVFISHRLTTTVNADCIYLFDQGKIKEWGTHEELMKQNGTYKKMFESQSKKYLGGDYNGEN